MRSSILRLALVGGCVAAVLSCDAGPITPVFGNGIAGGTTGTAPIVPLNPSAPDTQPPDVWVCGINFVPPAPCNAPYAQGQQINIGDSMLVVVRAIDNRQLTNIRIQGIKYVGDPDLGTLTAIVRYPTVESPGGGSYSIDPNRPTPGGLLQDTMTRRYIKPAEPLDSAPGTMQLQIIATDNAGRVDTAFHNVNLVLGPRVEILAPLEGDSVSQGSNMLVQVRVTHAVGVQAVTITALGESNWPAIGALNNSFTYPIVNGTCADCLPGSTARDLTINRTIAIHDSARITGRITITASAVDITSNPGSAPPRLAIVRQSGTTVPKVTQTVDLRLEVTDSISIVASGDNIDSVGFTVKDSTGTVIRDSAVQVWALPAQRASSARRNMQLNLAPAHQGKRVKISTYAVDTSSQKRGYSVQNAGDAAQEQAALAYQDSSLIVYGQTYALPRSGTVGDMVVDTVTGRARVIISNMDNNRLDVWSNCIKVSGVCSSKAFDANGVGVGSQPWGMDLMATHKDSLLVANSGGTNISRVFLGVPDAGVASMVENLPARIRTRTNFVWTVTQGFDNSNAVHFAIPNPTQYSDRPQFVGQLANGRIFFSTRPTKEKLLGTIRFLDPGQNFPDLRTYAFVNDEIVQNFNFLDVDSVTNVVRGTGVPDTIYVWDHLPGTNGVSVSVRAPTCAFPALATPPPGITNCTGATDARFDARFPTGLVQGAQSAFNAIHSWCGGAFGTCSDAQLVVNRVVTGVTDTTFIALSRDRNWIAFGSGNDDPGDMVMCRAAPSFLCTITLQQRDLTNNAAERIFGLAIDNAGLIVGAHGVQSYFASVEDPLHLRLQGVYGGTGTGGAGIAFHPLADGQAIFGPGGLSKPDSARLAFIADGSRAIHAVDIAYFIRRGRFDLKHQLYGPLRVTLPIEGDNTPVPALPQDRVILKLYGISLTGGLTVIDVRPCDLQPVPGTPKPAFCP